MRQAYGGLFSILGPTQGLLYVSSTASMWFIRHTLEILLNLRLTNVIVLTVASSSFSGHNDASISTFKRLLKH
jgi:hypothetical protein